MEDNSDILSPRAVMEKASDEVKELMQAILKIEKEFEHVTNLSTSRKSEISKRILKKIKEQVPG